MQTDHYDDDIATDDDIYRDHDSELRSLPPGSVVAVGDIIPATDNRCALRVVRVYKSTPSAVWVAVTEVAS